MQVRKELRSDSEKIEKFNLNLKNVMLPRYCEDLGLKWNENVNVDVKEIFHWREELWL